MPFEPGKIPEGAKPFEPGVSGNPDGKPIGTKNRSTIAKKWLEVISKGENPITKNEEELTEADWQMLSLIKQGRRGNYNAIKLLFEYLDGPMENKVDLNFDNVECIIK